MAPLTSIKFVDAALKTTTGSYKLAYSDPEQKWLIRKDLLALLQDFPTFSPSMDTFTHNDGTSVNLLNASGELRVRNAPSVPITIWVHQRYPLVGPIVLVTSSDPVKRDHPFVDRAGLVSPPYLNTWSHPRSNMSDLVRHLAKLFGRDHPLVETAVVSGVGAEQRLFKHQSMASKMEAIDRVSGMAYYDITAMRSEADQEVEHLLRLQEEMLLRSEVTSTMTAELELEKTNLETTVRELNREVETLQQWLDEHEAKCVALATNCGDIETVEKAFKPIDDRSRILMDCSVSNRAIEDTIYVLDEAVEMGLVNLNEYIKEVRKLAREQFKYIAMRVELEALLGGQQDRTTLPVSFFIFSRDGETVDIVPDIEESLHIN